MGKECAGMTLNYQPYRMYVSPFYIINLLDLVSTVIHEIAHLKMFDICHYCWQVEGHCMVWQEFATMLTCAFAVRNKIVVVYMKYDQYNTILLLYSVTEWWNWHYTQHISVSSVVKSLNVVCIHCSFLMSVIWSPSAAGSRTRWVTSGDWLVVGRMVCVMCPLREGPQIANWLRRQCAIDIQENAQHFSFQPEHLSEIKATQQNRLNAITDRADQQAAECGGCKCSGIGEPEWWRTGGEEEKDRVSPQPIGCG